MGDGWEMAMERQVMEVGLRESDPYLQLLLVNWCQYIHSELYSMFFTLEILL